MRGPDMKQRCSPMVQNQNETQPKTLLGLNSELEGHAMMRRAHGKYKLYNSHAIRTLKRVSSFRFLFSIFVRSEPATAEEQAGTQ